MIDLLYFLSKIAPQYKLKPNGAHGLSHWARVLENGLRLAEIEGGDTTVALRLGCDMEGQRRLAPGFGSIDLDDAAPRDPADTERQIQSERSGRDGPDLLDVVLAKTHDGALAELPLDLRHGHIE